MKLLYIGYLLKEELYLTNPATNTSGGIFEEGLLYELSQLLDNNIDILTLTPNNYFPDGPLFSGFNASHTKRNIKYTKIPYVNLPIAKHISAYLYLVIYITVWIIINIKNKRIIMHYNLGTPIVQAAGLFSHFLTGIYPIVCDLFVTNNKNCVNFIDRLKRLTINEQFKYLKKSKGAIILNKNVALDFKLNNYLIIDGAVSRDFVESNLSYKPDIYSPRKLRYAGALDELHGSKVLVEIAQLLRKNNVSIDFEIAGRGNDEDSIKKASNNGLLKYVGQLTRVEANKFIESADILVIPHQTKFNQLRYQFSSKMFDYMASNKIVIVTPMPGFPEEYKQYVNVSSDDTSEALYNEIIKIINCKTKLYINKSNKARDFAIKNRTWRHQADKIISFIEREGNKNDF